MQKEKFTDLIISPFAPDEKTVEQVKIITIEFPYFYSAQLLFSKLLKETYSIHFDSQLKIAAAYSPDRAKLYDLMEVRLEKSESDIGTISNIIDNQKPENLAAIIPHENETDDFFITEFADEQTEEQKNEIKNSEIESVQIPIAVIPITYSTENYFDTEINNEPIKAASEIFNKITEQVILPIPDEKLPVEQPTTELNQQGLETHSFLNWLSLLRPSVKETNEKIKELSPENTIKTNQKNIAQEKSGPTKIEVSQIIEKFIREEPRITPAKANFFSPVNMARKSVEEQDDIVSPTLAQIYQLQGNPQKAIETYQKLILLYPEKSAFFAAQIEKIKKGF